MSTKWHDRFIRLATEVSTWSRDPGTKVGCIIVDPLNRVVSLGFNGFPRGVSDDTLRLQNRETKLRITIHAEENALLFAKKDVTGHTAYVTHHPCSNCAAKLIQSGISKVVYKQDDVFESKWADSIALAKTLFSECGVEVVCMPDRGSL